MMGIPLLLITSCLHVSTGSCVQSEEVAHESLLVYIATPIPLLFIYLTSLKITIFSLLIPYSGVGRKNLLGGQTKIFI